MKHVADTAQTEKAVAHTRVSACSKNARFPTICKIAESKPEKRESCIVCTTMQLSSFIIPVFHATSTAISKNKIHLPSIPRSIDQNYN